MINGPWKFDINGNYNYNFHSWNNNSDILYIDQPIGVVGFSKNKN